MSNAASVNTFTILEKANEEITGNYGSGMSGIPMPDVEEISMEDSGLNEFGEVCLDALENPKPLDADPLESKIRVVRQTPFANVHKLELQPLGAEIPKEPYIEIPDIPPAAPRVPVLSQEQSNSLNFKAISDAFSPLESNQSVIPEAADCILWLKQPLYNTTTDDGRLFITANHPSLKLIAALIDFAHYIDSVREPAYRQLTGMVQEAAKLQARDFQKYTRLTEKAREAVAEARMLKQRMVNWLYSYGERVMPVSQSARRPIEFSRSMLRYELAVHRLMRAIWPLVLKKLEQRQGRESEEWRSAFFVYGNILRSTQVISEPLTKYQLLESLPSTIAELLQVFNFINLKEVIREEILCRLMEVHMAIVRGQDGTDVREHQMDAAFAFRCLKGNVFAENEYQRLFNAEGRLSARYFEQLIKRVHSSGRRLSELEEVTIEQYRKVVSTEPEVKRDTFKIPQPDIGALIRRTLDYLSAPPALSPSLSHNL